MDIGLKFDIDSGFSSLSVECLIMSSQYDLTASNGLETYQKQVEELMVQQHATSMHQYLKWAMTTV